MIRFWEVTGKKVKCKVHRATYIYIYWESESFIWKLFSEILRQPKPHGQVVRGVIGFSFQLAIIQHQLKNFTRLDIATCTRMKKKFKIKKQYINDSVQVQTMYKLLSLYFVVLYSICTCCSNVHNLIN